MIGKISQSPQLARYRSNISMIHLYPICIYLFINNLIIENEGFKFWTFFIGNTKKMLFKLLTIKFLLYHYFVLFYFLKFLVIEFHLSKQCE